MTSIAVWLILIWLFVSVAELQCERRRITERLDKIERKVEQTLQAVHRLIAIIEIKTFMRPQFLESSPAQRTFGEKVERVCNNFAQGESCIGLEIALN